jgi:hypothetical protein
LATAADVAGKVRWVMGSELLFAGVDPWAVVIFGGAFAYLGVAFFRG